MPDPHRLPSDRDATGRDLGDAELALLTDAIRSGHLSSTGGELTPRFEQAFARRFGRAHAVACASGSAAVHAAVASLGLAPGDEVVTTPITDMGAILPICYEGGIPAFADVDPDRANVTAETLARAITPRTRALIVTHLFGLPCRMAPIVGLARARGLVLIEDCAQAFLAEDAGRLCATFGDLACFSFQQGKHMTTGEGGMVVCDDPARADAVRRFVNKGWGYGDPSPDHDRPGLNFRMTELHAAVGLPQLDKLDGVVVRRERAAARLAQRLAGLEGIGVPTELVAHGSRHAFWRFALRVDPERVPGGPDALGARLRGCGVENAPRYVKKPAFACGVFRDAAAFPPLALPWRARGLEPPGVPPREAFPGAWGALDRLLVLPWNEHYLDHHVDRVAAEIRAAHALCTRRTARAERAMPESG